MVAWWTRWRLYHRVGKFIIENVNTGDRSAFDDLEWWVEHLKQQVNLAEWNRKLLVQLRAESQRLAAKRHPEVLIVNQEDVEAAVTKYLETEGVHKQWEQPAGETQRPV